MAKKLKWLSIIAKVFLTGNTVKKDKCDRCGTDMDKVKMEKSVEYLCPDCTKDDLRKLGDELLTPKVDEVVGKVNEKIEGNAVKIDETLAKAEEVAGQVEQIKESTQVIKDIFKDKK